MYEPGIDSFHIQLKFGNIEASLNHKKKISTTLLIICLFCNKICMLRRRRCQKVCDASAHRANTFRTIIYRYRILSFDDYD